MRSPCCLCRGRSAKLLMVLASRVIIGSESRGTHDHILLSHDSRRRATICAVCLCVPPNILVFFAVRVIKRK
jgi:hypothetical protein